MTTLHIEHAIVDFGLWSSAFGRFAEFRVKAVSARDASSSLA